MVDKDSSFNRMSLSDQLSIFRLFFWTYLLNKQTYPRRKSTQRSWSKVKRMKAFLKKKGVKERRLVGIMTGEASRLAIHNLIFTGAKPLEVFKATV